MIPHSPQETDSKLSCSPKLTAICRHDNCLSNPFFKDAELSHSLFLQSNQNLVKKPMLVELHSFPGYDHLVLTPLPPPYTALDVLTIVTDSQHDLKRKVSHSRHFSMILEARGDLHV